MKKVLLFSLCLTAYFHSFGQMAISGDSIFIAETFTGIYGFGEPYKNEMPINVRLSNLGAFSKAQKTELEALIKKDVQSKLFMQGQILRFEYFPLVTNDSEAMLAVMGAGEYIEGAGRAYNGAIVLSLLSSGGGTALALGGFPIAGAAVSLGGGLIAFIVHVSGNMKLIKGGRMLKPQQ